MRSTDAPPAMPRFLIRASAVGLVLGLSGGALSLAADRKPVVTAAQTQATSASLEMVELLPSATVEDWVTFTDHLITGRVVASKTEPPGRDDSINDEGMIARTVTVQVERIWWSREGAPEVPATVSWSVPEWAFDGGERRPFVFPGSEALRPGNQVLVPLVLIPDNDLSGPGGWAPLATDTVLGVSDGTVEGTSTGHVETGGPWVSEYAGRPVSDLADAVDAGKPYPELERDSREGLMKRRTIYFSDVQ